MKPRIAITLGDPAGVGPELVARLLASADSRARAQAVIIGDRRELEIGMEIAGQRFRYITLPDAAELPPEDARDPILIDCRLPDDAPYLRAVATERGGRYSLMTFRLALALTKTCVHGILFAPVNKTSMHMAGMKTADESEWFARHLGYEGTFGELNVLDELWTSRVTSHVALKDVSALLSDEKIVAAVRLIHDSLSSVGVARPRIAVCGLNPHNGDNGAFGREEIEVIAPAVLKAGELGYAVSGPFPADTIFVRARDEKCWDGVVTMYHDQGQIAMKLLGFRRGATVHGGLPVAIATPAHGTAFDIYGQGRAAVGAMEKAFELVVQMAIDRMRNAK